MDKRAPLLKESVWFAHRTSIAYCLQGYTGKNFYLAPALYPEALPLTYRERIKFERNITFVSRFYFDKNQIHISFVMFALQICLHMKKDFL